jgi:hypothetical protein
MQLSKIRRIACQSLYLNNVCRFFLQQYILKYALLHDIIIAWELQQIWKNFQQAAMPAHPCRRKAERSFKFPPPAL